jgi:small-conductance mechanosensitive channel
MSERIGFLVRLLLNLLGVLACSICLLGATALAQQEDRPSEPFAFEAETINEGLSPADPPLRLDTPRAAIEAFHDAVRSEDFGRAAHVLNLNGIPADEQADQAPRLALKLAFVLRRYDLVDWRELSDQPDARVLPNLQSASAPYARRSIELGNVQLAGRPVPISLQRFHTADETVWLFSPFVVERIEDIFEVAKPGVLARWIPLEERLRTFGQPTIWEWSGAAVLLLSGMLIGLALFYATRLLSRRLPPRSMREVRRGALPLGITAGAVAFRVGTEHLVLLTGPLATSLDVASEVVALTAGAWLLFRVLDASSLMLSERYVVPLAGDDPEHRRTKTTAYVTRRLALAVVGLLSAGYILYRVDVFEDFGVSILASAGALGVLVAIAARPLIGNMVAGLQITMTDPVRVGDVVVFDGHWATVEDISFAHTVLRTWTNTRLIVPHSELLARPFENWSKEGEAVKRIIKLPVDFRIDVDRVREKVGEVVKGDPRSTGERPIVEMVEISGETAVLWIWISGTDSFSSWYLHNEIKEALVAYLRDLDGGAYLPRKRHVLLTDGQQASPALPDANHPLPPPRAVEQVNRTG